MHADEMQEPIVLASPEAEQNVLGAILLSNEAYDRVAHLLTPADFAVVAHARIYAAMGKMINQNQPVDPFTLSDFLSAQVSEIEIRNYAIDLLQNTPSAANIVSYANVIKKHATNRRILDLAGDLHELAYNTSCAGAEKLNQAEAMFAHLADKTTQTTMQVIGEVLPEVLRGIDERMTGGAVVGLETGFTEFDQLTSGLKPGQLILIAGRPSMGKTTLGLNIADHVAVRLGLPAAVFSLEMPKTELAHRSLASVGRIELRKLDCSEDLTSEDWDKLGVALEKTKNAPLHLDDNGRVTLNQIRAACRRLKRQGGLSLVVIDYLQLMEAPGETRQAQIADISRGLKLLAKEFEVPVIALSQLNRELEKRPNKRPLMADLRESGALEQDSDLILFVYRDEVYHPDSPDKGLAEIIIAKHRNGPKKTIRMKFRGEYTLFENHDGQYDPPPSDDLPPMSRHAKRGLEL